MTHAENVYKYLIDNNLLQDASLRIDLLPTTEDFIASQTNPATVFKHPFMKSFIRTDYPGRIEEHRYFVMTEQEYEKLKQDAEAWKLLNP